MRRSRKPRVIYRDSRDRISRIQQAFSLSDEELTGIMLVSPQTTRNWVNGYSHTSRSMRIHRQRIDLLEKPSEILTKAPSSRQRSPRAVRGAFLPCSCTASSGKRA